VSWPKEDMFAVTFDGKLLMNARALDDVDLSKLARKKGVFVGSVLTKSEERRLLIQMYDACSEAAAFFGGERRTKRHHRRSRGAK
jgi:hypothetical protein